jgi:hypothetical protein
VNGIDAADLDVAFGKQFPVALRALREVYRSAAQSCDPAAYARSRNFK